MKREEFEQTREFQSALERRGQKKKETYRTLLFALLFVVSAVCIYFLVFYTSEEEHKKAWFVFLLVLLLVLFTVGFVLWAFFAFRSNSKRSRLIDKTFGAWLVTSLREKDFDFQSCIKNGVLEVVQTVPETAKDEAASWVSIGKEGERVFDLTVWGGADPMTVTCLGGFLLCDFLEQNASPGIARACVLYRCKLRGGSIEAGGVAVLIKDGKWTFSGRMLRGDYRKTVKYMKKRGFWEERI